MDELKETAKELDISVKISFLRNDVLLRQQFIFMHFIIKENEIFLGLINTINTRKERYLNL